MMKNNFVRAALLAPAVLFLLPSVANAYNEVYYYGNGSSYTYESIGTATVPDYGSGDSADTQGGVLEYSDWPNAKNTVLDAFPSAMQNRVNADISPFPLNWSYAYGWWGGMGFICQAGQDSDCGNQYPYTDTRPAGNQTATRLCQLSLGDSNAVSTLFRIRAWSSPDSHNTLTYSTTAWNQVGFFGNTIAHNPGWAYGGSPAWDAIINGITCKTFAPPQNSLTGNVPGGAPATSLSITAAQAAAGVYINWSDTNPADTIVYPDPVSGHSGYYLSTPNNCTSSGFPLTTTSYQSCNVWRTERSGPGCGQPASAILAVTAPGCTITTYCADPSSIVKSDPTGSATVYPSAPSTTYTYSCTNTNGTTVKSVTVNVAGGNLPDLTALTPTPSAANPTPSTPVTFTAPIENSSAATAAVPAGTAIPILYQVVSDPSGAANPSFSGATNLPVSNGLSSGLAIGQSKPAAASSGTTLAVGTYAARACANTTDNSTFSVPESNTGNNCGSAAIFTVTAPAPDLTAGTVSPSTATAGTAVTLSATIANAPVAATGARFPDLFEISSVNNPPLFSQLTATRSYSSAPLAAGASNTASASYTFSSAGTWYVRACANTDVSGNTPASSYAGAPESNYANNCSPSWTTVTVSNPTCANGANNPPACNTFTPSCPTLSVSSQDVNVGDTVTLTWACQNASSCTQIQNSDGFTTGNKTNSSDTTNKLTTTGPITFGMTCGGANFYFPTVTVHAPTCSLSASPNRVAQNGTVALTVSATDVKSCTITAPGYSKTVPISSGTCSSAPITSPAITAQTEFTLTCTTVGQSKTSTTLVNLLPGFQEF